MNGTGRVSYEALWEMLAEKNISKTAFAKKTGISKSTIAKLEKNENVSLSVILKICYEYNCGIRDVVRYVGEHKSLKVRQWDIVRIKESNYLVVNTFKFEPIPIGTKEINENGITKEVIYYDEEVEGKIYIMVVPILDRSARELSWDVSLDWLYDVRGRISPNYITKKNSGKVIQGYKEDRAIACDQMIISDNYSIDSILDLKLRYETIVNVQGKMNDIRHLFFLKDNETL